MSDNRLQKRQRPCHVPWSFHHKLRNAITLFLLMNVWSIAVEEAETLIYRVKEIHFCANNCSAIRPLLWYGQEYQPGICWAHTSLRAQRNDIYLPTLRSWSTVQMEHMNHTDKLCVQQGGASANYSMLVGEHLTEVLRDKWIGRSSSPLAEPPDGFQEVPILW